MNQRHLPVHPRLRHPLTGEPLRAVYVDKHGTPRWPVMGAAPDDPPKDPPSDPPKDPPSDPPKDPKDPPKDPPSDPPADPGFPRDTPIAQMTAEQQAAYWRHQSRKHEDTWKGLVGDRTLDDVRNDITEAQRARQARLTPSEKALQDAEERGRQAATADSAAKAATAILKANLQALGKSEQEINDLVAPVNMTAFVTDGDVDTDRVASYARSIAPAAPGGGGNGRWPDMGQGNRKSSNPSGTSAGREMYADSRKK